MIRRMLGILGCNHSPGNGVPTLHLSLSSPIAHGEGDSGSVDYVYTLTLTRAGSNASFPFSWAVTGTGANPASASDFGGTLPSGSGTFAPGETTKTITVSATGDTTVETDETFLLTVTAAGLSTVTSSGTITNDDTAATLTAPVLTKTSTGGNSLAFDVTFDASYVGKDFELQLAGASNYTTPLAGEGAIRSGQQIILSSDVVAPGPAFSILLAQPNGYTTARLRIRDDGGNISAWSNDVFTTVAAAAAAAGVTVGGAALNFGYAGDAGSSDALSTSALTVPNNSKVVVALWVSFNGYAAYALTAKNAANANVPLTLIGSSTSSGNDRLFLYWADVTTPGTLTFTMDPSSSIKEAIVEAIAITGALAGAPSANAINKITVAGGASNDIDQTLGAPAGGVLVTAVGVPATDAHTYVGATKLTEHSNGSRLSMAVQTTAANVLLNGQTGSPVGPSYTDIHVADATWSGA